MKQKEVFQRSIVLCLTDKAVISEMQKTKDECWGCMYVEDVKRKSRQHHTETVFRLIIVMCQYMQLLSSMIPNSWPWSSYTDLCWSIKFVLSVYFFVIWTIQFCWLWIVIVVMSGLQLSWCLDSLFGQFAHYDGAQGGIVKCKCLTILCENVLKWLINDKDSCHMLLLHYQAII